LAKFHAGRRSPGQSPRVDESCASAGSGTDNYRSRISADFVCAGSIHASALCKLLRQWQREVRRSLDRGKKEIPFFQTIRAQAVVEVCR
jgi:hypothetical protein